MTSPNGRRRPGARTDPFAKHAAVFGPTDQFLPDRIQLLYSLRRLPKGVSLPLQPNRRIVRTLWQRKSIRSHNPNHHTAMFRVGLITIYVDLGHYKNGDGSVRGRIDCNINRLLRDSLVSLGKYPSRLVRPGATDDNFIDAACVAADVDLRKAALAVMLEAAKLGLQFYRIIVRRLFSFEPPEELVNVAAHKIELACDRPSKLARAVPRIFELAWRHAFPETERALWKDGSGSSTLRAVVAVGENCKLYTKHDGSVRFEQTVSNPRIRFGLGRPLRLVDVPSLDADLERLNAPVHQRLLDAQDNLLGGDFLTLAEFFEVFAGIGSGYKVKALATAFLRGERFHHVGGTHVPQTTKLRRMGLIRYLRKGRYAPAGRLHRTVRRFAYVVSADPQVDPSCVDDLAELIEMFAGSRSPRKVQILLSTFLRGEVVHNQARKFENLLPKLEKKGWVRSPSKGRYVPAGLLGRVLREYAHLFARAAA